MGDLEVADWDQFLSVVYPRMKPHLMMEKGLFKPPADHVSTFHRAKICAAIALLDCIQVVYGNSVVNKKRSSAGVPQIIDNSFQ